MFHSVMKKYNGEHNCKGINVGVKKQTSLSKKGYQSK